MEIFIGILVILYVIFCCFPAFMYVWEEEGVESLGCSGILVVLVGFPGAIIAGIALGIEGIIEKEKEKERIERERKEQEKALEAEKKFKAAEQSVVEKYYNSAVMKEILQCFGSSTPYRIIVKREFVRAEFSGGRSKTYIFLEHNFPDLPMWMHSTATSGWRSEREVCYPLCFAKAVNLHFGSRYSLNDRYQHETTHYSDGDNIYHSSFSKVEMTLLPTRSFF